MQKIAFLAFVLIFSACSIKVPDVNLEQKCFNLQIDSTANILCVSKEQGFHFVLFDALGAPKASRILKGNKFSSNKFLPQNAAYDDIFIKTLEMINKGVLEEEFNFRDKKVRISEL